MALTDKLSAIGAAIREKGGTTELLTLAQMPDAIAALPTGGGSGGEGPTDEELTLTGNCDSRFINGGWDWFVKKYGNRITTKDITDMADCFYGSQLKEIPFELNIKTQTTPAYWTDAFRGATMLESIGKINNMQADALYGLFRDCYRLRYLPEMDLQWKTPAASKRTSDIFNSCYSLREIPEEFLSKIYNPKVTSTSYIQWALSFYKCYALNEIKGINPNSGILTSNSFNNSFLSCYHLKGITFNTINGTPITAQWKNQTIDLSTYVGWAGESDADETITTKWNSGITADKEVTDAATYAALKNDPDWWSRNYLYSRFGHDAAVELINTLPDTSAYIKAQGASNNIVKFYTNAGMNTDGGSVSQLTEEEVAVAAAKGWTISYTG